MNTTEPPVVKRHPRKSGVVVPQQPKWHGRLAASALWLLGTGLQKTWRVTLRDESGFSEIEREQPVIFAIWHNRLAVAMSFWAWRRKQRTNAQLAALISAGRDGGLLAQTFQNFDVTPIRGSSSRRGAQALLESARALRQKMDVAITPDGPRGPKYVADPGIIALAQVAGVPILPAGARISGKIQLRSWDRFQVPLPFARCELTIAPPIRIPRDATDHEREQARLRLESELKRISPH